MASQNLTEYERKRLENIKRNDEKFGSLNIHSKLADLYALRKCHREQKKKTKSETPSVIRRSLRTQGRRPDSRGLAYFNVTPNKQTIHKSQVTPYKSARELVPLSMRDVSVSSEPDEPLVKKILSVSEESRSEGAKNGVGCRVKASIDLESMKLMPVNIARVLPSRILTVKFFPSVSLKMVVVGNAIGDLGFWNIDSETEDGDGIYMYRPHPSHISSICIHPFSMNKIITCSYYGLIRSLDITNEIFDLTYSTEEAIHSMSQRSDDVNSLYIGEGRRGVLCVVDERSKTSLTTWNLHDSKINSIDFNPENTNIMATSSSDNTVCIWDLRKLGNESNPISLKEITRDRAVHSAYFSPSGNLLATSLDDKIGVVSGANYEDEFSVFHNNQTGTWRPSLKGVWGWDDSYIFVGNMEKGVDVISTEEKRIVTTLESPHGGAIPCRFDAHPLKAGMLAGVTNGGHVYIWSL